MTSPIHLGGLARKLGVQEPALAREGFGIQGWALKNLRGSVLAFIGHNEDVVFRLQRF